LRFQDIVVRSGERNADGTLQVEFFNAHQQKLSTEKVRESFERYGKMPLPPYILKQRQEKKSTKEWPEDRQRYQNIFADPQNLGSVAAPTAGLHFTEEILQQLQQKQIRFEKLTLHVGRATFQPIQVKDYRQHRMGQEWFSIPQNLWQEVCQQRTRVFAVGTTTVRALESAKQLQQPSGVSELFIYPGYQISTINGLLTNFHLPDSTLILLVMAFVGEELTRKAYAEAVAQKYRFFSYGDAMLIL
jgi:S-adenosylmethionine:tRNA ribosyltransferase-isomerase